MLSRPPSFVTWTQALAARHEADLTFAEVRSGLQALSRNYVGRALDGARAPLSGRGKRAAFALYYAVLHYCIVEHVCQHHALVVPPRLLDLGCGTGVGAAAWALSQGPTPIVQLHGVDLSEWALSEARWNWRQLGLVGSTSRADMSRQPMPQPGAFGLVMAFSANELGAEARSRLLLQVQTAARLGGSVVLVEPISRAVSPWWPGWYKALAPLGAAVSEHKFATTLPEHLARYGQAAGLDHRRLTARALVLAPGHRGG